MTINKHRTRRISHLKITRSIIVGISYLALAGCVGSPKWPNTSAAPFLQQKFDEKTAKDAWRSSQVVKYGDIWISQNFADGDPFITGKAAYYLALATLEPEWSKAAITAFDKALEVESDNPHRARAGLGAAHRLAARDFPITGAAQYILLGIPGWIRTYHVLTSFSHLNRAVEAAPNDPIIRLYRAAAFVGIPEFFGGRDKGIADYEKLEQWTNSPSSNSAHLKLLSSGAWRDEYYLMRAQSMKQLGHQQEAIMAWKLLLKDTSDDHLRALARYRLANDNL
jgi:tetratricopeptide (TPR) repeat protein